MPQGFDYDETADRRAKRFLANKGLSMFERKFFAAALHVRTHMGRFYT